MKVGVIGAGQLGKMMAMAGKTMGIDFVFYAPEITKTVRHLGETITGDFADDDKFLDFASKVDVMTYESENIPLSLINLIEKEKLNVFPPVSGLKNMQDRLLEKTFFNQLSIPTNDFYPVNKKSDLYALHEKNLLPLVLKKRRNSYDGKGQFVLKTLVDINHLSEENCFETIAETLVNFNREVSIIGVRNQQGEYGFYDLCENVHQQGVLFHTQNKKDDVFFEKACNELKKVMDATRYVGVCTLEFFQVGDKLLANELAPRVHNSGHWTIEGAVTNQFENHLRAILALPLGEVKSYGAFFMANLLGNIPSQKALLNQPGIKLHDYQKSARKGRKVGHVNVSQNLHPEAVKWLDETLIS